MAIKTKKVKAYLSVEKYTKVYSGPAKFCIGFNKSESWEYISHHQLGMIEVEVPDLSESEMEKLATGALLEAVVAERERYKEESIVHLARLDARIEELKCIEFKGGDK